MLADVLRHATSSDDSVVLASAADTINYHFDSLTAIGATTDLFRRLSTAYIHLKKLGPLNIDLVFSLIELGLKMPGEATTLTIFRQDLSRMENKSAFAASSPVSDHIPEISSEADPSLHAKLDQVLSSAGGIDEPTLDTIFNVLTKGLESGADKLSESDIGRYLVQLRCFQPKRFDGVLVRWITGLMTSPTRPALSRILPPLIGVGCVTLQSFLSLVRRLLSGKGSAIPNAAGLKVEVLELLVPQAPGKGGFDLVCFKVICCSKLIFQVSYRFQLANQDFLVQHSEEALDIIRDTAESIHSQHPDSSPRHSMGKLLHVLLTQDPDTPVKHCKQILSGQQPEFIAALQETIDSLFGSPRPGWSPRVWPS